MVLLQIMLSIIPTHHFLLSKSSMSDQNDDKKQVQEFSFLKYLKENNNLKTITIL